MLLKFLLVSLLCVHTINSASAPFIKKCTAEDSKCMKSSAQAAIPVIAAGIPELGVESLDPFIIKNLHTDSPTLKLSLKDITAKGLSKCIAKKIQRDVAKSKLFVKLLCTVEVDGKYNIDGDVVLLRVQGDGAIHAVLRKVEISVEIDQHEVTGSDGQPHWVLKNYKHSFQLKDKASLELENLFNGNELLGRTASELLANNPNEIVDEVGPPLINAVVKKIVDNLNRFFDHVSISELTL